MTDAPSTAAIADALDVDETTLQRCLSQHPELALAHVVAFVDPEDLDAGFLGVTPSDVFYTRPASAYGRDEEGTQTSNRLREEPNSRGPPFTGGDRLGTGVLGSSRNRFFARLRQRVCASPGSGASTPSGAASSRRRASHALK
jgi:hypothetical protein